MIKKIFLLMVVLFILVLVIRDSKFHFKTSAIEAKRKSRSSQRHWIIGDVQQHIYIDSPIRYQDDLEQILKRIEPGYALLSDRVTSYYAAATLPVYIINLNRHHETKMKRVKGLYKIISHICYVQDKYHRQALLQFLRSDAHQSRKHNWPELRYILLNKDKRNSLLLDQCMAMESEQIEKGLLQISTLLYEGKYLNIYQLNSASGNSGVSL